MAGLGLRPGDAVLVSSGSRVVALRAWPLEPRGGEGVVALCRFHREALGVKPGDFVEVEPVYAPVASRVVLAPLGELAAREVVERRVVDLLRGKPLALGEVLVVPGTVPPARLAVVAVSPGAPAVTVGGGTVVEVRGEPAASLVASTGDVEPGSLVCLGERSGGGLVLLVEPGRCAWVWRGTRVERITLDRLVELLASSGLLARGLSALLRGEEPGVPELAALLALALRLAGRG